jgi:hypothetical protein
LWWGINAAKNPDRVASQVRVESNEVYKVYMRNKAGLLKKRFVAEMKSNPIQLFSQCHSPLARQKKDEEYCFPSRKNSSRNAVVMQTLCYMRSPVLFFLSAHYDVRLCSAKPKSNLSISFYNPIQKLFHQWILFSSCSTMTPPVFSAKTFWIGSVMAFMMFSRKSDLTCDFSNQ